MRRAVGRRSVARALITTSSIRGSSSTWMALSTRLPRSGTSPTRTPWRPFRIAPELRGTSATRTALPDPRLSAHEDDAPAGRVEIVYEFAQPAQLSVALQDHAAIMAGPPEPCPCHLEWTSAMAGRSGRRPWTPSQRGRSRCASRPIGLTADSRTPHHPLSGSGSGISSYCTGNGCSSVSPSDPIHLRSGHLGCRRWPRRRSHCPPSRCLNSPTDW